MKRLALAVVALLGLCGAALAQVNSGGAPVPLNGLTNTVVAVKASPGGVYTVSCNNPNAAVAFLQFFDTTGAVTPGTTVPKFSLPMPLSNSFSFNINANFINGIKVLAATTPTGGTAPGTALNCALTIR